MYTLLSQLYATGTAYTSESDPRSYEATKVEFKLNSLLTCFQQGFMAQLVEHRTGIMEVMGSNP